MEIFTLKPSDLPIFYHLLPESLLHDVPAGACLKGKGVSYMENLCEWHGQAPKEDQYNIAIAELKKIEESLS